MPRGGGGRSSGGRSSGGFGRSGSGSSGGYFGGRSARAAPRPTPAAAPHASATQAKPSGGLFGGGGGLGATMAQGAAFGAGSGLAHAAVGSMFGGSRSHATEGPMGTGSDMASSSGSQSAAAPKYYEESKQEIQESPCTAFNNMFLKCLQSYPDEITRCQNQMDSLVQCERDNANIM